MDRRAFVKRLTMAVAAVPFVDPEELIWTPRQMVTVPSNYVIGGHVWGACMTPEQANRLIASGERAAEVFMQLSVNAERFIEAMYDASKQLHELHRVGTLNRIVYHNARLIDEWPD